MDRGGPRVVFSEGLKIVIWIETILRFVVPKALTSEIFCGAHLQNLNSYPCLSICSKRLLHFSEAQEHPFELRDLPVRAIGQSRLSGCGRPR